MSRSPSPTCTTPPAISARLQTRWPSSGASSASTADLPVWPACRRRCARATGRSRPRSGAAANSSALWPGLHEQAYGLAVDVGSTTIAAHLTDLITGEVVASAGLMNPQIRFGEDLMSRVSYIMMNPGGDREMTSAVREALDSLVGEVAREAGIDRTDVLEMTLVGNPIMHHLVLGLDPVELGGAPFALTIDGAMTRRASSSASASRLAATCMRCPASPAMSGPTRPGWCCRKGPYLKDELTLLVDVGTNAEIVLGNRSRLLACSSPTGPAFEGAQISCGQRAAPGAIERVRIDRDTLEPRYKVIGCDLWSDEPGFAEATGQTGVTGICGSGIIEVIAEMWLAGIITQDGVVDGAMAARSPRIEAERPHLLLPAARGRAAPRHHAERRARHPARQGRALRRHQAADGPLRGDRVERITLAGAFGSHIDVTYAMVLGLIPDCDLAKVASAGNAAGTGARIALLNARSRGRDRERCPRIEKIETALEPAFQAHFVDAMAIPNKVDPFTQLSRVVRFPEPKTAGAEDGGRRRRRREG